jgi:NAD-dependent dihydropyrimidine dehydrogenase PreA subunit
LNAYLVVANSRGVNVWCAAAGGLFTHHDVVSALKTSGIEGRVDHRTVILPQLAAAGIEAGEVRRRAGWEVVWGPASASGLPAFLQDGQQADASMRSVSFDWLQRVEMAAAWSFPISAFVALALFCLWRAATWPAVLLTWGLALLVFLAFPLYERWLGPRQRGQVSTPVPRLAVAQGGLQLILWVLCVVGLAGFAALSGNLTWAWLWRWGLLALVLVVLVTIDLTGMTPVTKSGTHEDRLFRVVLDVDSCAGEGTCEQVCPRGCFVRDPVRGKADMPGSERCVRCGACVVQCPCDALSFVGPADEVIDPATVRRFKLNLMGKRARRP